MANFKRKKSRRSVRCTMCTPVRWLGNHSERHTHSDKKQRLLHTDKDNPCVR